MAADRGHTIDKNRLPEQYPTHIQTAAFWECLGRAIASFGFLEEVLGKAIFAFSSRVSCSEEEASEAYAAWILKLERALYDQLGSLIDTFGKAVRDHLGSTPDHIGDLLNQLRNASQLRNVICHGSWRTPNSAGASVPFYVDRRMNIFDTPIDLQYLTQLQKHVQELICGVINTVTEMGWNFPGSNGPGKVLFQEK